MDKSDRNIVILEGMATAFKGADTVLVCIASGEHTEGVVQAVLAAGADGVGFFGRKRGKD